MHNRIPSLKTKVSLYELWKERKSNLRYLKVWECIDDYRVLKNKKIKLGSKTLKSVFVGYVENSKTYIGYLILILMFVESRDIEFFENKFFNNSRVENDPQSG